MYFFELSHLVDPVLLRGFDAQNADTCFATAKLLAYIAEVDKRRLYLPAAHPSMFAYCVHRMGMSDDTAYRRISVARKAREFPAIFHAIADGRLNLTAATTLGPYLTPETADELIAAAAHKTKDELARLLAERFPKADVPAQVLSLTSGNTGDGSADQLVPERVGGNTLQLAPERVEVPAPPQRAKTAPLSPGRFALQVTLDQAAYDQLRYVQALLGHAEPSGDLAKVLGRALKALADHLERQKFARASRSGPRRVTKEGYVPAAVRREVWLRDGGQCTFVSEAGCRCASRSRLEFDHIEPVARGGRSTTSGVRLRCRAHNQYAAECAFGAGFMRTKREEARRRVAEGRARAEAVAKAKAESRAEAAAKAARQEEVVPWLRRLGYSTLDARRGAALCADLTDAPLEQRVRVALRGLAPHCVRQAAPMASSSA